MTITGEGGSFFSGRLWSRVGRRRTRGRRSNGRRRGLYYVTWTSYCGVVGGLRGLGVPCFSFRGCAR